jgi:hypothetical protein
MTAGSTAYEYVSLTAAIADKASPLRRYFDRLYPYRKALQEQYTSRSGQLLVPAGSANPGTLGAAFDFVVRFVLDPSHLPRVAVEGFIGHPERIAAVKGVIDRARASADCRFGPAPEQLLQAGWALGLCTEVYRLGGIAPGSPLVQVWAPDRFTTENLMALASADAVEELQRLHELATSVFYPALAHPTTQTVLGPTFSGSTLCAADADMIVDGCLFELKVTLGRVNRRTGLRHDELPLERLYQLLGYVLFDYRDQYGIHTVGFYSARYGGLTMWPLTEFTSALAGHRIDIAKERNEVWRLLGGKP